MKTTSALDFIAPGMFTFASIFLIMMVAQSFAQDRENGMMKRIRISPTTPTEFMTSQVVSYMGIALIQAALVFAMTYALGFQTKRRHTRLRIRLRTGAGILAVQRGIRLNHRNHRKISRCSHRLKLPLRASRSCSSAHSSAHRFPQVRKLQANSYPATTSQTP